jgi:hypothetical protein
MTREKENKTVAEVLENLKNKGVKFENTTAPFSKESKNVSLMGNHNFQPIIIRDKKNVWQKMVDKVKNNLKFTLKN